MRTSSVHHHTLWVQLHAHDVHVHTWGVQVPILIVLACTFLSQELTYGVLVRLLFVHACTLDVLTHDIRKTY